MFCTASKKVSYVSEQVALESLIQHHTRNFHQEGRGPRNIYQCEDCGNWHFTSKGEPHEALDSEEVRRRIRNEQAGNYWERKLR